VSRVGRVQRPGGRHEAGLTLVELMVTMVLAMLVAASTFAFVVGQQRIYETQSKLVNVQQNLAVATEMMVRMVRAAGSGMAGCVRTDSDGAATADTGAPPPVAPALPLTGGPQSGVRAYLKGVGSLRIPPLWISNGAGGAPDTLTVAFGVGTFGSWRDTELAAIVPQGKPTSAIKLGAGLGNIFRTDEFALLFDSQTTPSRPAPFFNDRGCSLFRITDIDNIGNELRHASTSDWNPASDAQATGLIPFDYPANSGLRQLGTFNWVRFAVDPAGGMEGAPALTMQRLDDSSAAQVVAEGIVDLQIAYACDNNPDDGSLREGPAKLTDEWVLNIAGDAIPASCGKPDAVRITLVARSSSGDVSLTGVTTNVKPTSEDGAAAAAPDSFRYRTLTATVYPRN
jgi:type II secretory pathway pseudopilin PulG